MICLVCSGVGACEPRERCVICGLSLQPEDSGLCDAHKYDEQLGKEPTP